MEKKMGTWVQVTSGEISAGNKSTNLHKENNQPLKYFQFSFELSIKFLFSITLDFCLSAPSWPAGGHFGDSLRSSSHGHERSWSCFMALEVIAGWQAEFNIFELPGGMSFLWRTAKVTKLSEHTGPGPQPMFQRGVVTHQPEQGPILGIPGFYKRTELGRHASSEDTQRGHTYCRNSM